MPSTTAAVKVCIKKKWGGEENKNFNNARKLSDIQINKILGKQIGKKKDVM